MELQRKWEFGNSDRNNDESHNGNGKGNVVTVMAARDGNINDKSNAIVVMAMAKTMAMW